ncbi:aspartate ammonia-lyase [Candidatus Woesebacteria bacterium]|nr:aspartate ammonia-lyase [Candidatus Woesebacteria bacterium]
MSRKKQYFGKETKKAFHNFPLSISSAPLEHIYAVVEIKKAAALANKDGGYLSPERTEHIVEACDEIISGAFDDQFTLPVIQGGAGTSIHMNVNEVIATRATELSGGACAVHPNDHVNMHQSTNDVMPSALRICSIRLLKELVDELRSLSSTMKKQAKKYSKTIKLGRTHTQDAVPITVGQEFTSYAFIIDRNGKKLKEVLPYLYELNMGGTAVGNSINAPALFVKGFYHHLETITNLPMKKAGNLMSLTSSAADFVHICGLLVMTAADISKIANDIRFLSSGPKGGIGEIVLEELQAGSSIMPGKVNPIIPELVNQLYYLVLGRYVALVQATEHAHLELDIMFPTIAEAVLTSLKTLAEGVLLFNTKCFATLQVNKNRSRELLDKTTAFATLFTPTYGYDTVSRCVHEAIQKGKTFKQVMIEEKIVSAKEFERVVSAYSHK